MKEITKHMSELEIEVIFITHPFLEWLVQNLQHYKRPLHYLSDILRWYIMHHIIHLTNSQTIYVIEADVVCITPNWMLDRMSYLQECVTLFGKDKACIAYHYARDPTKSKTTMTEIITMYDNIFEYRVKQNIFGGNFDHLMTSDSIEELKRDWHYLSLMSRPVKDRSSDYDIRNYLDDIPVGILGIAIRRNFNICLPFANDQLYDAERVGDYIHEAKQEWNTGKGGTKRKKRRKRKSYKKFS